MKQHPDFERLRLKNESMVSLPGLEIYPDRRKIYRDRREINLTAKEYDLLCLLVANKGRVLTYDQIYQKYKRTVWQCNAKFKGESKCATPHLYEQRIKELFLEAAGILMEKREEVIGTARR